MARVLNQEIDQAWGKFKKKFKGLFMQLCLESPYLETVR
jgi:hypothetical protein